MTHFLPQRFLKIAFLSLFFITADFAWSQTIWTNPIEETAPSSSNPYTIGDVKDPNINVSGIGFGSGVSANAGSGRYNTKGWTNTSSPDDNDYFTFTLTPNSGYKINFTSLDFTLQRSATGPATFAVRSSLDNFAADIQSITATGTTGSAKTVSLSDASFQNIASAITFHIYGYSATGATGTSSINDFTFNGQVFNPLLNEDFEVLKWRYYPNPVKDILNLYAAEPILSATIYSFNGQLVFSTASESGIQKIDLSGLKSGIYFIKASSATSEKTIKFSKQ